MSNKLRKMTLEKKHNLTGWAFLAPATFLIAVFSFWPMIKALVLSFQTGKGRNMQMAGFTNYIRMFQDDVFIQSIKNTFFYFILQVPIMLVVALVLACILNKKDLRFKGFFRTMIFVPCTTSLVAYSIIFRSLFANNGLVNYVLVNIGILDKPYNLFHNLNEVCFRIHMEYIFQYPRILLLSEIQSPKRHTLFAPDFPNIGLIPQSLLILPRQN